MAQQTTLEQLEEQINELPLSEQFKLLAYISEQLSVTLPANAASLMGSEELLRQEREKEADRLLALCDNAAALWDTDFDTVAELQQMRSERDEQLWPNKS